MQITRGNKKWCLGMDWFLAEDRAALRKLRKEVGKRCSLLLDLEDEGYLLGASREPCKGRVYSLAVLAAQTFGNGLFIIPVADDTSWLGLAQRGLPVVERDVLCPSDQVFATVEEWMSLHGNVPLIGDTQGALHNVEAFWQQVIEASEDPYAKDALLQGSGNLLVPALAATLVGLAAAWWFLRPEPAPEAPVDLMPALPIVSEAEKQRALDAVTRRYTDARANQGAIADLLTQDNRRWRRTLDSLDWVSRGYRLKEAYCEGQVCNCSWERLPFARVSDRFRLPGTLITEVPEQANQDVITQIPVDKTQVEPPAAARSPVDHDGRWLADLYDGLTLPDVVLSLQPPEREYARLPGRGDVPLFATVYFEIAVPEAISLALEDALTRQISQLGGIVEHYSIAGNGPERRVTLAGRFIRLAPEIPLPEIYWDNEALKVAVNGVPVETPQETQ